MCIDYRRHPWQELSQLAYRIMQKSLQKIIFFPTDIRTGGNWFYETGTEYNEFIRAFLKNDLESMNEYMNEITYGVFSYFDTGSRTILKYTMRKKKVLWKKPSHLPYSRLKKKV